MDIIDTIGERITERDELIDLLKYKEHITCYDGFEPSGRMHIAQGLIRTLNTNKLTSCGYHFKFWVADWFAMLNNKFGGDLKKIGNAGKLMIEIWKTCGMELDNVEFIWSSTEINKNPDKYWSLVMDIACKNTLKRILRCTPAMGRSETDNLLSSQIFYPCMQCADIFYLGVDICSLGVDQEKVNMLAREYCSKIKRKCKPIIVSHHMLMGLNGKDKMSKSDPHSAIFMDDTPGDVKSKIKKAWCPLRETNGNPVMEYYKYIIFEHPYWKDGCMVCRKEINGGDIMLKDYNELADLYSRGELHPEDVKHNLIRNINILLSPIQERLKKDVEFKKLVKLVKSYAR